MGFDSTKYLTFSLYSCISFNILNIIHFAVPILLIVLVTIDLVKAIISQDDEIISKTIRTKNWIPVFSPENICLKTCSTSFPEAQSASFQFSTRTLFRAYQRSIAAAGQKLISTETDSECPWQVPICS